jgi:ribonucleoside-diphosphate reductase beta chain
MSISLKKQLRRHALLAKVKGKGVFGSRETYKPFEYPWAYEVWLKHEQIHWLSREVPLHEDVRDWSNKLTQEDRNFLTDVFLLFVQSDVDVAGGYVLDYLPHFSKPELRMMLLGFAGREATHIDAYSYLLDQLGKHDNFYSEFLNINVMKAKHSFFQAVVSRKSKNKDLIPIKIAAISAFTEGMFLFSSFIMLLNYPRNGLMKGMGQVVTWSILDEQIHVEGLTKLFTTMIEENPNLWTKETIAEIYSTAEMMAELEIDFIELVYKNRKEIRGLAKADLITYIKYIVDRRLIGLGLKGLFKVKKNPLPWVDEIVGSQNHENFFETRATSYAKGSLNGSWSSVWGTYDKDETEVESVLR